MRISFLFILLVLGAQAHLVAQSVSDALRFSRFEPNGGARYIGVMGSMGALGADFGVMSSNPAGLASFRKSELVLTAGLYVNRSEATLLGNDQNLMNTDRVNRFVVPNFGLVISHSPIGSSWKTFNVGIGLQQLANYRQQVYWEGLAPGTITDRFLELANGLTLNQLDDFEAGLAYDVTAILGPDANNFYSSDFELVPGSSAAVRKSQDIIRRGYMNELQLAFSSNYDDKLYTGITVGIPILSYHEEKVYAEFDDNDAVPYFNSLLFEENVSSSGTGINLRLGFIYRANQMVRVGGAVHTPTWYSITDDYHNRLTYNYTDNQSPFERTSRSPDGVFDYRLATPWRLLANLGLIFAKNGFLSAEIEYTDYSTAAFNFTRQASSPALRDAQRLVNNEIQNTLRDAVHFRLGGEITQNIFRFRAGIGFSGTEYAEGDMWAASWSAGFGIRENNFYLDLGFRRMIREEGYIPYQTSMAPQLNVNTKRVQDLMVLTLGIKI